MFHFAIWLAVWSVQGPGLVLHYITIPGVFFHELAHQLMCYLLGHRVLEVRYLEFNSGGGRSGCVIHRGPPYGWHNFLIGMAPLFLSGLIWSGTLAYAWWLFRGNSGSALWQIVILGICAWVAISATYSGLPSDRDLENLYDTQMTVWNFPLRLITWPFYLLGYTERFCVMGWTPWRVAVIAGTVYAIISIWF